MGRAVAAPAMRRLARVAPAETKIYDAGSMQRSSPRTAPAQVRTYSSARGVREWLVKDKAAEPAAIYQGSCEDLLATLPDGTVGTVISSPPYCMGKSYERSSDGLEDFVSNHRRILPEVCRVLRPGGSLCWQVGFHIVDGQTTPLDFLVYELMRDIPGMKLRNRIAWTFGHGLHCRNRFSGRHEAVLWYTKGDGYVFDLDAVRVPQKYPGKLHTSGPNKGRPSGNPGGKNPSDVWNIPNVNANHPEKTEHPCQFPVGLAQRLVRALSAQDDLVLDPFCGVASAGVAAVVEGRRFLGAELEAQYATIGAGRLRSAVRGTLRFRPADRAVHQPSPTSQVGRRPPGFAFALDEEQDLPELEFA